MVKNRESLKCPLCGADRLIDTTDMCGSEVYPVDNSPNGWEPDYIQKCHCCKQQIGIKKILKVS